MRNIFVVLLGLLLGSFLGEALAAMAGMICFAAFSSIPSGPMLWILRSLPVISASACAVAAVALTVALNLRRRPG